MKVTRAFIHGIKFLVAFRIAFFFLQCYWQCLLTDLRGIKICFKGQEPYVCIYMAYFIFILFLIKSYHQERNCSYQYRNFFRSRMGKRIGKSQAYWSSMNTNSRKKKSIHAFRKKKSFPTLLKLTYFRFSFMHSIQSILFKAGQTLNLIEECF